jgi:hypothetical protein
MMVSTSSPFDWIKDARYLIVELMLIIIFPKIRSGHVACLRGGNRLAAPLSVGGEVGGVTAPSTARKKPSAYLTYR